MEDAADRLGVDSGRTGAGSGDREVGHDIEVIPGLVVAPAGEAKQVRPEPSVIASTVASSFEALIASRSEQTELLVALYSSVRRVTTMGFDGAAPQPRLT